MKKVLIVDDSDTVRTQVASALVGAGFQVAEAVDGLHAVKYATEDEVDLMLLDVNMPVLNPVVMLTTEAHMTLIENAKRLGARSWIVKPVKLDQLVAAVTRLTNAR